MADRMNSGRTGRRVSALSAVVVVLATVGVFVAPAAQAQPYTPITGSGSTWSSNALDQWRRNVESLYGITVDYAATGSTAGRNDFRTGVVDFGVSEIEYGLSDGGVVDPPPGRGFAYMPIVAGGTAFLYNLKIGNNRVTNLRLSGATITKIFSRQITNWSDPAIKADNPGLTLPARAIVPVVRSDGSGTTAQFTRWMAAKYGAIWDSYCGRPNCGFTSNFPVKTGVEAKSGSNGVTSFATQATSEGAITYVEYSYARNAKFPVVKVLNDAGYFVEPKATSVAVALTKAAIRPDLTQDLSKVYGEGPATDKRAYPLSSYSYMIIPTNTQGNFTPAKGRTLSSFAYYFLCEGQQQADALGYSPLPVNLVQAAVKQVARIPGTTNKLSEANLTGCNNPTFNGSNPNENRLAQIAPNPPECDKQGAAQCAIGTAGATQNTPTRNTGGAGGTTPGGTSAGSTVGAGAGGGGPGAGGTNAAGAGAGGTGAAGTGAGGTGAAGTGAAGTGAAGTGAAGTGAAGTGTGGTGTTGGAGTGAGGATGDGATIDPATGEIVGSGDTAGGDTALAANASAIPVQVDLPSGGERLLLAVFAIAMLGALVLGPPLVSRRLNRHRSGP